MIIFSSVLYYRHALPFVGPFEGYELPFFGGFDMLSLCGCIDMTQGKWKKAEKGLSEGYRLDKS